MKTLKVIIVLIGFMFSFNNQIFAIECDITKFSGIIREVAKTQFKDEAKLEELASYSVCGTPIKTSYEAIKKGWKTLVDLEKYEKQSGSKVSEKGVLASESSKKSDENIIEKCDQENSLTQKFWSYYMPVVQSEYSDTDAIRNLYEKYYNNPCSIVLGGKKTKIKQFFQNFEMMAVQLNIDIKAIINEKVENVEKSPEDKLILVANRRHHSPLSKMAVIENKGLILTGDESGYIGLWDSRTLQLIKFSQEKHKSRVKNIVITDSNDIITTDTESLDYSFISKKFADFSKIKFNGNYDLKENENRE